MTAAEVVVIGAGISGMATAARLQARGVSTLVLEAHGQVGGCAGFFRRRGFSFDVGATTLVDFEPGGVGGDLLRELDLRIDGEALPGYLAWLPDRVVALHRDPDAWHRERLAAFGDTPAHRALWALLDRLAATFWAASRNGIELPLASARDAARALLAIPAAGWALARYARWTIADALAACGLAGDTALYGLFAMLLQDTVHAAPEEAPLVNGALGITIRGAGLTRARGGTRGFWQALVARYRELGGMLVLGTAAERVRRSGDAFVVETRRGEIAARYLVSTLPIWDSARLGPPEVARALAPYLERDGNALGGAVVVFVGAREEEVADQDWTHHQILLDYHQPLGNGNNMFISVSAPGDTESAPPGKRVVMISTHCELAEWEGLSREEHAARKAATGWQLLERARRVYPRLGERAEVFEVGTPRTYARYTRRHRGAVGGIRSSPANSNQRAVPHDLGVPGYWQAGDTTWPGLGTVACVLGSRHVADRVAAARRRRAAGGAR